MFISWPILELIGAMIAVLAFLIYSRRKRGD
jgi:LPXTG-motif cell wall-anchored protein